MPAANHPDYQEELGRCRYTLEYVEKTLEATLKKKEKIDHDLDRVKRHYNSESSQDYIDMIVNTQLSQTMALKLRNLFTARSKPYFARVDFREEGRESIEKLYIGKMSLMREEDQKVIIVDWRAPIANLYYEERIGDAHYFCPDGDIKGELLLKRQFSINEGELQEMFDIDITTNDEFLQSYLGANADNRLKEIVSTIQVEQNRIIRADMWKPLIIQGAAGSGKTTIALHRIAYLIYTYEKQFQPENFMIIAPNKLFLNYISEVLPELGVEKVLQTTFEDFVQELLGKRFKIKDPNEKLLGFIAAEQHGECAQNSRRMYRASEFKSSMSFKILMDRFIEYIEEDFIPREDFCIAGTVVYTYKEINRLFLVEYKRWPVVQRIHEIKKHLTSRLKIMKDKIIFNLHERCDRKIAQIKLDMEESEERVKIISDIIDERTNTIAQLEAQSKKAVSEYIKRISKFSPWQYYRELMEDQSLFERLAEGIDDPEVTEFARSHTLKVLKAGAIETEDFAPLIYLKYCINGMDEKTPVKHIVIDEAQDFSVFQFYVLRKIVKDSSFTILGDLCQGIHAHRGVKSWQEIASEVFYDRKSEFLTLEQSYRTTVEIMEAANVIIRQLDDKRFIPAKPVIRHGEPVRLRKMDHMETMVEDLAMRLQEAREKGHKSAAIICKTPEECKRLLKLMNKKISDIHMIEGKEDRYLGGTVIVPSYLSKGLEFDTVFIADAGCHVYRKEELDMKLMYIAMTRALHKLYIYYTGEVAEFLQGIGSQA